MEEEKVRELPPVNFSMFVLSLNTSALVHLGQLPDPHTKEKKKDLALARQTIDILDMLKEKTRGNLTKEEEKLLDTILYELRMIYLKVSGD
ncbi:MAG TPA: DUF1844 domain-containing protein [Thermodesulfatator atlanticus]|uniref:DUF1844 domain-containing protein n=1 Tax=Thermodesulfatator atlanticus TaxID=501497 RepID=A0A7V5U2R4_9BACT|nr:DUF1844 domain-containing protein [Thermodesulfatator atlanticus]